MSLVIGESLTVSLGGRTLLDDASLGVAEHDRIGLIGPNGAGKSTLLRLLAGELEPDGGRVHRRRALRVGYLRQEVQAVADRDLLPFVVESVPGRAAVEAELDDAHRELEEAQADGSDEERLMEAAARIADTSERLDHFETQFSSHQAEKILMGLGFGTEDLQRDVAELSGGWRMRAVLAALLFQQPDLLLLDEPTNHLDMPSVAWFGGFLSRYKGAFVLISHDREFLNEQIARVLSFEPEGLRSYDGNYEQYLRQRAEEQAVLQARARNLEQRRAQLERFVDRFGAKASKARQAQSRLKQLEKMDAAEPPETKTAKTAKTAKTGMRFRFPAVERSGKEVLRARGLHKAYGAHVVLDGIDLRVDRGDRIAIIGRNGAGKTTLLRILAGELEADAGDFEWGYKTKVGYYAQHHADVLDPSQTAYDAVWACVREGNATLVRGAMGALRMRDEDVDKRVGVLSGGERARVALARLMVDPGNVLLMDEPTNHLDLESTEGLVEALEGFQGTLLFVSHNRRFLRALATKIWNVADGAVDSYPGNLDDYLRVAGAVEDDRRDGLDASSSATPKAAAARESRREAKERKRREAEQRQERSRVLGPLKKRIAELETKIAKLEADKARHTATLADPDVYTNAVLRDETTKAFDRVSAELEVLADTWLEAHEELEAREREITAAFQD